MKKISLKWVELDVPNEDYIGRPTNLTKIAATRRKKLIIKVWYHPDIRMVTWYIKQTGWGEVVRASPASRVLRMEFLRPVIL